jgi:hypothetical protein
MSVVGDWKLHYSWGSTTQYQNVNLNFKADGTIGGGAAGKWRQTEGTVLLAFDSGPAKYGGNIEGNVGSGSMSTFNGLDGTWYMVKQGVTGLRATAAGPTHDVTGNGH